jgi:hypothetical protein
LGEFASRCGHPLTWLDRVWIEPGHPNSRRQWLYVFCEGELTFDGAFDRCLESGEWKTQVQLAIPRSAESRAWMYEMAADAGYETMWLARAALTWSGPPDDDGRDAVDINCNYANVP